MAKHVARGDEVTIYVVTDSGYTDYAKKVIRDASIAHAEGVEAAAILGADLICGDCEALHVEYNFGLISSIKEIIDERQIDTVYTHWIDDVNQDHHRISQATFTAARHVPRLLMYRSNWYHSSTHFKGNFYVDTSDTVEKKIAAIKAHRSEYERVGEKWLQFTLNQNQNAGYIIEVPYAEAFEVIKYLVD
ncbi:PIG-L family deacetylase [Nitrospinae bacterium AH_259_B05_G02_I21]|nr:PIG-L family deacetylase [Nitrospinae bacterium AH_259_B05_G02_I21]MDA2931652.1 PIG-L family deacetylase [Nitrospinae bacterium AH-259-F20]